MTVYVLVREDQSEHGFVDASIVGLFRSQDEAAVLLKSSMAEAREQGLRVCGDPGTEPKWEAGTSSRIRSGNPLSVCRRRSALPIEQSNERLGVTERVMDGIMIMRRSAETFPLLSAAKIADQPCVEIGGASSGMPERVLAEIAPEVEIDPLESYAGLSETSTTGIRGVSHSRNCRNVSSEQSTPWNVSTRPS